MKIRLERDVLAEAVQWAARSLPLRPSVPILAGLLVRADAEGVTFSSFDYETSAQIHVAAAVADEGQALVSGRLLADISRSLPAKPVDIAADDTKMELICGSARFTLQTLPVSDYPWRRGLQPAGKVRALNTWIKQYAASSDAIYLDYYGAMANQDGGLDAELAEDGVHPTPAGYALMAPLAERAIERALSH